jgi:hypothetical protein
MLNLKSGTTGGAGYNQLVDETVFPPSFKGRQYEVRALGLRDFARVRGDEPLDPFALAHFAKLMVINFDEIKGLSKETREHLLGEGANSWSGGTASRPLPNGWRLVILNPKHGAARNNATLMEEVCHVFLGHKANRLHIVAEDKNGKTVSRVCRRRSRARAVRRTPTLCLERQDFQRNRATLQRQPRVGRISHEGFAPVG